ncbi:MAG: RecQ family ATP-dependent DNA helicase [Opitutaceae bacterium]|nr:RecQ family ATP-dependent DNA helicase [Cytophagales bacterium]
MHTPGQILLQYWGFSEFRLQQEEIVNAVTSGKDVLALLPTGGGKSVCYQVPGLMFEGVCIVVSPLIALMKDQVEALKKKNITAEALFSGLPYREIDRILDNCVFNKVKFLYVAPERLKSNLFLERFQKMTVSLIAIDEAHCISEWGYDFRPSYLNIHEIRVLKPKVPCIALSATATPKVQEDIQVKLKLKNPSIFRSGFSRKNLNFSCYQTENKQKDILRDINRVEGQGIIYVRSRKAAKELALFFQKQKTSAVFYHAGMTHADRQFAMEKWLKNEARIMIATNAFGMGIDKDNVRFVFHYDVPESLEAYYQEAGRAGRDGERSVCVLYYHESDINTAREKLEKAFPPIEFIKKVYQNLANYYRLAVGSAYLESFDFDIDDFRKTYSSDVMLTYNSLKTLEDQAFINLNESFHVPSKVTIIVSYEDLYEFQVKNPKLDIYIKTLLRLYGGDIYTHYLTISESKMARNLQTSLSDITYHLNLLVKNNIIAYEPANGKPKLTFLSPRYDASTLPLDRKKLETLKGRREAKLNEMIEYIHTEKMCRMLFITEYFGELTGKSCGLCDNCRKQKINDKELYEKLLHMHLVNGFDLNEFISQNSTYPKDKIIHIFKQLTNK